MKMKKWLVLVALLVGAASAQATVFYWSGDWLNGGTSDGNWATINNWYDTTIGNATALPGAAEHVIVDENVAAVDVIAMPTISSAVPTINILGLGWGYAGTATLTIEAGGALNVAGAGSFTRLGQAAGSTSYLNMTGGSMVTPILHVGFNGDGIINMSGDSIIETADLGMAAQFALGGTGVINMADNAKFRFDGDQVTLGQAANIIAQGWITAPGAGESIVASYDAGNDWTEFTVIPEPATLSMVALLGGGMLWMRKRLMI